jgi:hypothetical protein
MSLKKQIFEIEAERVLGTGDPKRLPQIAVESLVKGIESKALVELAGIIPPPTSWAEVDEVWTRLLTELNIKSPTEQEALTLIILPRAQKAAVDYFSGGQSAGDLLKKLDNLASKYHYPDFLKTFPSLASAWSYSEEEKDDKGLEKIKERLEGELRNLIALKK